MRVIEDAALLEASPKQGIHLAIGMFDGLHIGHQSVLREAIEHATRAKSLSAALTFDPHPSHLFRPNSPTPMMMAMEEKQACLAELGLDCLLIQPFNREFAAIEQSDFIPWLRSNAPSLEAIYVGENFQYGRARAGDAESLIESGREQGVEVYALSRIRLAEEIVSSTRIREYLLDGDLERANAMLGRPYSSLATPSPGRGEGRKLGYPTLNLPWSTDLQPRHGVYAVRLQVGEQRYEAVANFGLRPTIGDLEEPLLEVHCLEGEPEAEQRCRLEWLQFLRPEKRFASLEKLKAQLAADCETARAVHAKLR